MLKVQRRHRAPCTKPMWDGYLKCRCPILIIGTLNRKQIKLSTAKFLPSDKAKNLDEASALARLWEREGKVVHPNEIAPAEPVPPPGDGEPAKAHPTIEVAVSKFIGDSVALNRKSATVSKKKTVFQTGPQALIRFAQAKGIRFLAELDIDMLREWRKTWNVSSLVQHKRQCSVLGFLWWCERSGWYPRNYASDITTQLGKVTVTTSPTGYFEPAEYKALIDATYIYSDRPSVDRGTNSTLGTARLRTVIELMRWTGLRISDAVTLEKSRLRQDASGDWSVGLYQKKTGDWVHCPIPPFLVDLLLSVPASQKGNTNDRYFFWTGNGTVKTLVTNWQRTFVRFFKLAAVATETVPTGTIRLKKKTGEWVPVTEFHHKLIRTGEFKHCHAHMFRDTFAVESMLHDMPVETVQEMLGHASVKVTQDHYMPWVLARQNKLSQQARNSWEKQGIALSPKRGKLVRMTRAS